MSLSLNLEVEKLKHVNQQRPKGPTRRPPSSVFKDNVSITSCISYYAILPFHNVQNKFIKILSNLFIFNYWIFPLLS